MGVVHGSDRAEAVVRRVPRGPGMQANRVLQAAAEPPALAETKPHRHLEGERQAAHTFGGVGAAPPTHHVALCRGVGTSRHLEHGRLDLSDPVEGGPFHRPREDLGQPLHLLGEPGLTADLDETRTELGGGGTVEAARQVGHGPHAHPAPQDVGLGRTRDIDGRRPRGSAGGRHRHGPRRVDHAIVDPHPAEELSTTGRIAEEVADRLLIAVVPGLLEGRHLRGAAHDEAEHERLARFGRHAGGRVGLARDPHHLHGQGVEALLRPGGPHGEELLGRGHRDGAGTYAGEHRPPFGLRPRRGDVLQARSPHPLGLVGHPR